MANSKITACICLSFLTLLISNVNATSKDTCVQNQQPISKIILSFGSRLVKEIGGEDNFFFSPLSISAALAMIFIGTEGTTKLQMSNALQYYFGEEKCMKMKISEEFRTLMDAIESKKDDALILLIANGIFVHVDYTVSPTYTSNLQNFFKAHVNYLDFSNDEEKSLNSINEWISEHTKGMIPRLLNEPLDTLTVMVLLNVMYFKGFWEAPFSENNTFYRTFYSKNGTRRNVPFMHGEASLNYYYHEESRNSFLDMYYMGSNVSMLLVLPSNMREFPNFELNSETLCMLKREMQPHDVTVILPKFKLDYKRELSKDMINLGLNELFSEQPDLSGIRKENDLHVSLMVHQAVIEVDESGSEAAAVSGVGIDARRKPTDHVTLMFDHPFQFYIINKELDLILFAGRVADPV